MTRSSALSVGEAAGPPCLRWPVWHREVGRTAVLRAASTYGLGRSWVGSSAMSAIVELLAMARIKFRQFLLCFGFVFIDGVEGLVWSEFPGRGCRGGGDDHDVGFCSPAPTPFQRCVLRRLRGASGMLYRSRWRLGAPELGERQEAGGSSRFPRRRPLEASDLGSVELVVVSRPMCHNRHGSALRGGLQIRLTKPQCDGASADLWAFLRLLFLRQRSGVGGGQRRTMRKMVAGASGLAL